MKFVNFFFFFFQNLTTKDNMLLIYVFPEIFQNILIPQGACYKSGKPRRLMLVQFSVRCEQHVLRCSSGSHGHYQIARIKRPFRGSHSEAYINF